MQPSQLLIELAYRQNPNFQVLEQMPGFHTPAHKKRRLKKCDHLQVATKQLLTGKTKTKVRNLSHGILQYGKAKTTAL